MSSKQFFVCLNVLLFHGLCVDQPTDQAEADFLKILLLSPCYVLQGLETLIILSEVQDKTTLVVARLKCLR